MNKITLFCVFSMIAVALFFFLRSPEDTHHKHAPLTSEAQEKLPEKVMTLDGLNGREEARTTETKPEEITEPARKMGPSGFEPNPHQDIREVLNSMLIPEQIAILKQPLDGGAYQTQRVKFFESSVDVIVEDKLYNPQQAKLNPSQAQALKSILANWNERLRPGDSKIHELEIAHARRQYEDARKAGTDLARTIQAPRHHLEKVCYIEGPHVRGTYRFEYGMIPERDKILAEQSAILIDAELELLGFFQSITYSPSGDASKR